MASGTPFDHIRARIAGELKLAIKARDRVAAGALRAALGALDNATAVPGTQAAAVGGPAEVPGRAVAPAEMATVLLAEARERAAAAVEYTHLAQHERAERLKVEARIIRLCLKHVDDVAGG